MADDKATLGKIVKLLSVQKDLIDKLAAVTDELDALSGGRAGIGENIHLVEGFFDMYWGHRYAGGVRDNYMWNFAKDRAQIKRLLKSLTVTEIQERMHRYMKSDDPFYVRARHSFPLFVASINSWAAEPRQQAGAVDCWHMPPCIDDQEHTRRRMQEVRA